MKSSVNLDAQESIQIAKSIEQVHSWRRKQKQARQGDVSIGFVPTMGALHKGHETLIEEAVKVCDLVIVSIFVNPTQFGPGEDLDKYPRTLEADIEACKRIGAKLVFCPQAEEIYGASLEDTTFVDPAPSLVDSLEGVQRPGHFRGVATVVSKLFNIVQPDKAYFGEKDFQQLLVVRRLVEDLKLPIEIVGVPIVREEDGLALSSRNTYLTAEQRLVAPNLQQSLQAVKEKVLQEDISVGEAIQESVNLLEEKHKFVVEYLTACDPESLKPIDSITAETKGFVLLVAAKLGDVRLIDNLIVRI